MSLYKFITVVFFILLFPLSVSSQITLNEIYPAPKDGEFEWLEIYNPTDQPQSLDQFVIKDLTGKPMIFNGSVLAPHSYGLATSSALLNNKDETVFLTKKTGEILETVIYGIQFDSEKSYTKCPDTSTWQPAAPTKLSINICPSPTPTITPSPSAGPSTAPATPTGGATSYEGIIINEVMAAPQTGEKEWVELYNKNDYDIDLSNWYIDSHQFSLIIPAHGYATTDMTSSIFTNAGDTIQLMDSSKTIKDSFQYSDSEKGLSWGRTITNIDSFCLQDPSKGHTNNACHSSETTSTTTKQTTKTSTTATPKNSASSSTKSKQTAHLYEGIINKTSQVQKTQQEEKEYRITGYKNELQPTFDLVSTYGFYTALALSLLAFGMVAVKMKRYLYEKDSLMALALVTAVFINGYHFFVVIGPQYQRFF